MAILQVRDIDEKLYESLKIVAKQKRRSISQQVIKILESHFSNPSVISESQTEAFLNLTGAWESSETAEEMIRNIRTNRKDSTRFGGEDGLLD